MTRILAVVDPNEDQHYALQQFREIPPRDDVDIHAVLFVQHESEIFAKTFAEQSAWLKEQVLPYIAEG